MLSDRPEVLGFDDYGFAMFSEHSLHRSEDQRCHEYHITEESDSDVLLSQTMRNKLEENPEQKVSTLKLRNFIKKGTPPTLRGDFWLLLVGSRNLKNSSTFDYQENLSEVRNIMVDCGVTEYGGKTTARLISRLIGSFDEEDKTVQIEGKKIDKNTETKLTSFRQILLDADRSYPTHAMFMEGTTKGKEGRAALFRILAVYVLYNPEVSYCQGMSYIGGMLLMNMNEEDAFWMLVSLFERPKYLSGYYDSSLSKLLRKSPNCGMGPNSDISAPPTFVTEFSNILESLNVKPCSRILVSVCLMRVGFANYGQIYELKKNRKTGLHYFCTVIVNLTLVRIQWHSQVFERFLQRKMPNLYTHLKSNGIDPLLYITPWFMALFTSLPCWDSILTIWDLLLLDGISVIFQASLAILSLLSDKLLAANDMSSMLPMLLRLPAERIKRQVFVPVMCRWTIYSWEVDAILAIISDSNYSSQERRETKRKIIDDENGRAKKVPRLRKQNSLARGLKNPSSLFQKFTKFFVNFLPNSLKENAAAGLIINSPGRERKRRSSSCEPFTANAPTTSSTKRVSRPSPRKRHHLHTTNENMERFQTLRVTSPVRRSARIAKTRSESKCLNTPSTTEVIGSSPNTKHAFKMFITPTPLRISQITNTPKILDTASLQHLSLSPDVELSNF